MMLSTASIIKFELIWKIYIYIYLFSLQWYKCCVEDGSCVEPLFLQSGHTVGSVIMSLPHQVTLAYGIRTWNSDTTVYQLVWLRLFDLHSIHTETAKILNYLKHFFFLLAALCTELMWSPHVSVIPQVGSALQYTVKKFVFKMATLL